MSHKPILSTAEQPKTQRVDFMDQQDRSAKAAGRRQVSRPDTQQVARGTPNTSLLPGLGFHLREAYRSFCREFDLRLARNGVTHAQWVLLWFLARAGTLTPLELSREAGIQKASATAVIDALKQRRLIKGEKDRVDRRKVNLYVTPLGLELVEELTRCAAETNAIARQGLTDAEAAQLLRLLSVATNNLEAANRNRLDHSGDDDGEDGDD